MKVIKTFIYFFCQFQKKIIILPKIFNAFKAFISLPQKSGKFRKKKVKENKFIVHAVAWIVLNLFYFTWVLPDTLRYKISVN